MSSRVSGRAHKARELRRRVLVPARLRANDAGWADACILNVSTGGLLIRAARPLANGSFVELRRDDQVIHARVVWREGARVGLKADGIVPVEKIVGLQAPDVQLVAPCAAIRLRTLRRSAERSRMAGRSGEFVAAVAVGVALAAASLSLVEQAFARPLALVSAALGG